MVHFGDEQDEQDGGAYRSLHGGIAVEIPRSRSAFQDVPVRAKHVVRPCPVVPGPVAINAFPASRLSHAGGCEDGESAGPKDRLAGVRPMGYHLRRPVHPSRHPDRLG